MQRRWPRHPTPPTSFDVQASISTACGIGALAGRPLGGLLYRMPAIALPALSSDLRTAWGFRVPCAAVSLIALATMPAVCCFGDRGDRARSGAVEGMTHRSASADGIRDGCTGYGGVLTRSRVLTLAAVAVSGTVVACLDSTLANKLDRPPLEYVTWPISARSSQSGMAERTPAPPVVSGGQWLPRTGTPPPPFPSQLQPPW